MDIVFGDGSIGIKKNNTEYIFSYSKFGLVSLNKDCHEFIYRAPQPAFWRATTCNDRANGFSEKSSIWLGADLFPIHKDFLIEIDGKNLEKQSILAPGNTLLLNSPLRKAEEASITFCFETATTPTANCKISYHIKEGTEGLEVSFSYIGTKGLPQLPVCGIRFILTELCTEYKYKGLKGETYPDRMSYREYGEFTMSGNEDSPYVLPQEYGMHMNSDSLLISFADNYNLRIECTESPFNFSLIPFTPLELESALHIADLPPKRRSVLTIAAKVRGVGGINTWGADVGKDFQISSEENYCTGFRLI